jgi:hypothetical protein
MLHIITADGRDAVATLERGRHGGPALAIRDAATGATVLACKVEHVTPLVLQTVLDPGTADSVQDLAHGCH